MGHTKVRCTKPLVEDEDAGFGGDRIGAFGGEAGSNGGAGDFSTSNYDIGASATVVGFEAASDWGASTGASVNW